MARVGFGPPSLRPSIMASTPSQLLVTPRSRIFPALCWIVLGQLAIEVLGGLSRRGVPGRDQTLREVPCRAAVAAGLSTVDWA